MCWWPSWIIITRSLGSRRCKRSIPGRSLLSRATRRSRPGVEAILMACRCRRSLSPANRTSWELRITGWPAQLEVKLWSQTMSQRPLSRARWAIPQRSWRRTPEAPSKSQLLARSSSPPRCCARASRSMTATSLSGLSQKPPVFWTRITRAQEMTAKGKS